MSVAAPAAPSPPRARRGPVALRGLHLAVLSAFALAQPLFSVLGGAPEFFATRGSTALDVVALAAAVTVGPPLVLLGLEQLAGLVGARAGRTAHLALVGLLSALVGLEALKRVAPGPGPVLAGAALAIGAAAAVAYGRTAGFPRFLTVLGPAPVLFLGLFLAQVPLGKLAASSDVRPAAVAARTPIVFVLFDEFPTTSLLDRHGRIDAARYPSFARLARGSTWFRNATSVQDSTTSAVPALLSADMPRRGLLPTAADHPRNLFTLLGGAYRLNVFEEATHLCPRRLCATEGPQGFGGRMASLASDLSVVLPRVVLPDDLAAGLPPVSSTWMNFRGGRGGPAAPTGLTGDRAARFGAFLRSIAPGRRPTLDFLHVLMPHGPWEYLPSGRRYGGPEDRIPGLVGERSFSDPWLVRQAYQRHLLQTGYADRMIGQLVVRLRAQGLYDRSMIVVAADHGVGFHLGADRRAVTRANVQDVAPVPFFVKRPYQRRGELDRSLVRTVDVVPTIADLLHVRLPWAVDGRSAFSAAVRERRSVEMIERSGRPLVVPFGWFEGRERAAIARKAALFGDGLGGPGLYGIGPHPELLGRRLSGLATAPPGALRATIDEAAALRAVRPRSGFVPAHLTGRIAGAPARPGRALAVAVNGRIAAVAESSTLTGAETYSVLVPDAALRPGRNDVRVLAVTGPGLRLTPLGATGAVPP